LQEYQVCANGYTHTYSTIWQVGSIAAAIAAGLLTFGPQKLTNLAISPENRILTNFAFPIVASLPLFVWLIAIFDPMDRYGKIKLQRLIQIEAELAILTEAQICHFKVFDEQSLVWVGVRKRVLITFMFLLMADVLVGLALAQTEASAPPTAPTQTVWRADPTPIGRPTSSGAHELIQT